MKESAMQHSRTKTWALLLGFFVIGNLIGGMIASMGMLVWEGLIAVNGDAVTGHDFDNLSDKVLPFVVMMLLLNALMFIWFYLKYGENVRRGLDA